MRGYGYITATALNGVGTLAIKNGKSEEIRIIGRSLTTSVTSGAFVKSFSFELPNGKDRGVVALDIKDCHGHIFSILVGVRKAGNVLVVDIADSFVPDAGRLGQIFEGGRIEVVIGNVAYTNIKPRNLDQPHLEYRLADANSLCRYMVSMLDADTLLKDSVEYLTVYTKEEQVQDFMLKVSELEAKLVEEQVKNSQLKVQMADLDSRNTCLNEDNQELMLDSSRVKNFENKLKLLLGDADILERSVYKKPYKKGKFIFSGSLYKAIEIFMDNIHKLRG
jgi:hypothetical protein